GIIVLPWRGRIVIHPAPFERVVRPDSGRTLLFFRGRTRRARPFDHLSHMRYDIVAIVASARGLTPLRRLLQRLPRNLPVPVVCLSQADPSLASRLSDESGLEVRWASSTEPLHAGRVYLSPPGGTMLLLDGSVTVAPYGPESTSLHPP